MTAPTWGWRTVAQHPDGAMVLMPAILPPPQPAPPVMEPCDCRCKRTDYCPDCGHPWGE